MTEARKVPSDAASDVATIAAVYRGVSVTLRTLRAFGWGPALLNLGYFSWRGPLRVLNVLPSRHRLAAAQERLVQRAVALLGVERGERVLDVACGRGQSSHHLATTTRGVEVVGVDYLSDNVQVARTLFGSTRGLAYEQGNAMSLGFEDQSFDRVLCLEAAFHFQDKALFLREAARVLRKGGRLVVVDFMWRSKDRKGVLDDPRTRVVQETWAWQDFHAQEEYRADASAAGFVIERELDWSSAVTTPLRAQFRFVAWLGGRAWGRELLGRVSPELRTFSRADWKELAKASEGHRFVQRHAVYGVLVLRKGG